MNALCNSALIIVLVFTGLFPIPAVYAADASDCIPQSAVRVISSLKEATQVFPVGVKVSFVTVCEDTWAMRSNGTGSLPLYYAFADIEVKFQTYTEPGISSAYTWVLPVVGDFGVVLRYGNSRMIVEQLRSWTLTEKALLQVGNEFYSDMVASSSFYIWQMEDCPPVRYFIGGLPVKKGPWGYTYKVPPQGARLQAIYMPSNCILVPENNVKWSLVVRPGDIILEDEGGQVFARSLKDFDPWLMCMYLSSQVPAWQPKTLPMELLGGQCGLHALGDNSAEATLVRNGWVRAANAVDVPYVPYIWLGAGREKPIVLPGYAWEEDNTQGLISLASGDTYKVTVGRDPVVLVTGEDSNKAAINLVGGLNEVSDPHDSDIPGYEWGRPLVFVPASEELLNENTDWTKFELFRITLGGTSLKVQKMKWK